nr:MAG TPA: hypothetical protein [Bacteriophage sp.]
MRAQVTSTVSWFDNGDEIIKRYPFLKDPRFKLERVATGKKREFFDYKSGKWRFRDESKLYVTIDKLEDFQYFVEMVKKTDKNKNAYNGQTILMVDDDNNWELGIYDGYRE